MALEAALSAVTAADGTFSAEGAAAWLTVKERTATLTGVASLEQGGTGNSTGTATINANLTGIVTSVGNATAIADKAISYTKLADGTAGNLITWSAAGVAAVVSTGTSGHVLTSNGAGAAPTFQAAAGGAAALSGITAATAGNTIASGNNHSQIWNWALTSNSVNAFTFGETTAATGGTSTSGVPNQYIVRHTTLASSTASPWGVYVRGNHVISASPSARQLLGFDGAVANPTYGFAANVNSGLYNNGGDPAIASAGSRVFQFSSNRCYTVDGGTNFPAIGNLNDGSSGWSWPSNLLTMVVASRRSGQFAAGTQTWFKGTADAVGYSVAYNKARGTTEAPTAITTGDDLATIGAFGYVGATGTYVEAARQVADSDGTIANDSTGIGGIWRWLTRKVAGSLVERLTVDNNETADETSILVSINGGAPVRVSQGATDSGGTGYRVLRIPN